MDAFFASVEQLDNPELAGKPVAVGGSKQRGVVAAASYEARKYGVRSAMPSAQAYRLCPDIIFVKPRFERYKTISSIIREIFYRYTDLVEPLSLDEAYLDVTCNKLEVYSATKIAKLVCKEIYDTTGLTASAGISINKFLAKSATDINKPNGITLIPPDKAKQFLESLPIEKFYGIGQKTAEKMRSWGIKVGADLKAKTELELATKFGKAGRHYYRIVRAIDDRPVKPDRIRKSVGAENTFSDDLTHLDEILDKLAYITERLCDRIQRVSTAGKTVTLKIKYFDFVITTRSKTVEDYVSQYDELFTIAQTLLNEPFVPHKPIRLLGLSISNLKTDTEPQYKGQLTLAF